MDGGNAATPLSLREAFEKACPVYMSYGMSYDDFWYGDVRMHRMYRKAHRLEISEQNTMLWLQGRYVYDAIFAVSPTLRAFSKARRPEKYTEKPYDLFAEDRRRTEDKEARERYERIKRNVQAFATAFNEKRKEETSGKEVDNG